MKRRALLVLLGLSVALAAWPAEKRKKRKPEEVTQTLQLPKDPPSAVTAETARLVFHVSPLSSRGLLSQQVRDALKWLLQNTRGAALVRLRAFVAGRGDMRRVQAIVSEVFTDRHLALPALSVIQVGALPQEGAQVVLESIGVSKKPVNPHGLAFISGQAASAERPLLPAAPLVEKSVAQLRTALGAAGLDSRDVLRATCYLSTLDDFAAVRGRLIAEFPQAALNFVQRQRAPVFSLAECEAVARLRAPPATALEFLNPPGLAASPACAQIALVNAPRVALTGTQLAFGYSEADARLAFQRLGKALEQVGASFDQLAMSDIYPVSGSIAGLAGKVRGEFFNRTRPPASTMLPFEGLPSLDAAFAIDVVGVVRK
jgi:enamine deaminase RidA (YjgF/YER057c/UK114 family)